MCVLDAKYQEQGFNRLYETAERFGKKAQPCVVE